ncbi:hypothetical protein SK128_015014 [Halocaridina rubra]|uniref:Uncharacterized protein n=1 Tax=Halocaridina rubra TaxID=373956 RepID=A0AAN8XR81_HALRR
MLLTVLTLRPAASNEDKSIPVNGQQRHVRQLHRMLDPFNLLGKAGEAVNGAMAGMQEAVAGIGKSLDEGAQHVGKMLEHGVKSLDEGAQHVSKMLGPIDSALKDHMKQMQDGALEAGKVAKIVGEDVVDSMSTLVSNHLKAPMNVEGLASEDQVMTREGIVDGVLRMVGIDPSQIGLMALNILIFLAEMITSSLIGDNLNEIPETRSRGSHMFSWLFNNDRTKVENMLREAQDPSLPKHMIEKLVSKTGDSTACVQLLICKMSPVIWGIQGKVKEYAQERSGDPDVPDKGIFQVGTGISAGSF